jgi:uncharacterized protein (DUF1800 family)
MPPLDPSASPSRPLSRRGLLRAAAGTAAAITAGAAAGLTARPAHAASTDPLLHLLRRATFGPTPESEAEIRHLGAGAWLNRQLSPASIDDGACAALIARFPLTSLDIRGVHAAADAGKVSRFGWEVMLQVGQAAIARAAWSKRQLLEVMVDFWSNHLNVACPSDGVWDNRQDYDRVVIRRHTLGRYVDMLKASAQHPAMLNYLDNRSSTKRRPNENYARELLELHTVGLVHSEADVKAAAKLLTGLTVDWNSGLYRYDSRRHATGAVRVLGFTHANATAHGGEAAVMALLHYLALHPATARNIARKLCVRFVSDSPPADLVKRLADVYLAGRSAIAPVLRALFASPEFAAAAGAKIRTPFEDVVATLRVLGLGPEQVGEDNPTGTKAVQALYWTLWETGHAPMHWSTPDGYPDVATAWASTSGYLNRWNTHLSLAANWYPKQLTRPESMVAHLLPETPNTYGGLVDALALRLTGATLREEHRTALAGFFGKGPTSPLTARHSALGWKFPYLVALVLDSPYFSVR